ncbi:hypothetical protein QTP70_000302 [Hemibagrus guttatus]|uniref:Interferon-induced protein with tetratricopeptide repeats 5 n=1 Tax=Hemibagrus guttatus TaxID=175788 RepID=A0AAE0QPB0_9TELE|nr:hypothetical protein QTP70_000302 [Hemibagrus guttatus]
MLKGLGEKGWTFLKFSRKYYERSKECFKKALELEPDEGEWNAGLAIVLYRTDDLFQNSPDSNTVDQLRRAIATNPDDDVLKVLLGLRLVHHKKYSEAESLVEQALERSPEHPHVIRYVGKFFRNQGSVDRSIALLKKASEKVSNSAFIHHQLGLCYKNKGKRARKENEIKQAREQCIYHLERAIELKPNFILAMNELALQFGEEKAMEKAEEMFQNAFQVAEETNDYCQTVHLYYAEFQQYCVSCESAAIKHYIECLKLNPNYFERKKSAERLERIAKRKISNNAIDGEAFGILGIVYKEKGEKQKAIECFETALSFVDNEDYLTPILKHPDPSAPFVVKVDTSSCGMGCLVTMPCSTQDSSLKTSLLQLECHFTWALNKNYINLTDLLNRLEEDLNLNIESKARIAQTSRNMGFVKCLLGSNTEALSYFERSVELTKSHGNECDKLLVVVYGDLAWLYYHMGNFAECESYLNKLREIKVKYPSVPYAKVLGEKGWTFLKFSRKYYERSKECFKKALELEPDEGEWNAGLAIVLYRTDDLFQNSPDSNTVDQLRRAIATNPDDDVLKVLLGLRLVHHKKYSEAESLVEQALERSPEHPHVIRYVGKFFRNQGSVDRSIDLLKRALEKVSNSAFIHHQLGFCYKKKIKRAGRNQEIKQAREQCIYHLEMAIELKPNLIFAMNELALQYGENQYMSRAEEMFQNAFQIATETNDNYQAVHLYYADFQQYYMRCESAAIKHYMECLKINPKQFEGKKSAECLERIAKRRISNNAIDGEAFGILGIIYKEKGEKQKAIECFETALNFVDNEDYLSNLCELRL